MNTKNLAAEKRKQDRLEKLGTQHPVCSLCGETDDRCLEAHHIAGRAYATDTVIVCRNCHRKLSDGQQDHPCRGTADSSMMEIIGRCLLGLADFCALLALKLSEFGLWLIENAELFMGIVGKEGQHG